MALTHAQGISMPAETGVPPGKNLAASTYEYSNPEYVCSRRGSLYMHARCKPRLPQANLYADCSFNIITRYTILNTYAAALGFVISHDAQGIVCPSNLKLQKMSVELRGWW